MINVKELRLGSVIAFCTHPVIIKSVSEKSLGFEYCDKSIIKDFYIEPTGTNFTPVLLTEELLKKCGFEKIENDMVFQPELENVQYLLTHFEGSWVVRRGFMEKYIEIVSIKFMHELQNLLHSLGHELTVNI